MQINSEFMSKQLKAPRRWKLSQVCCGREPSVVEANLRSDEHVQKTPPMHVWHHGTSPKTRKTQKTCLLSEVVLAQFPPWWKLRSHIAGPGQPRPISQQNVCGGALPSVRRGGTSGFLLPQTFGTGPLVGLFSAPFGRLFRFGWSVFSRRVLQMFWQVLPDFFCEKIKRGH